MQIVFLSTPKSYWGGLATAASLDAYEITVDSKGNLFYADQDAGYMVPAVSGRYFGQDMEALHVYHIYGTELSVTYFNTAAIYNYTRADRFAGEEGPATEAVALNQDMTCDKDGNLYFFNYLKNPFPLELSIRMIPVKDGTYWGTAMKAGYMYTVPTPSVFALYSYPNTNSPPGSSTISIDAAGNLQVWYSTPTPNQRQIAFKIGDATQTISLVSQTGTLTAGTVGSATFAATTANIDDGTGVTVNWCDQDGTAADAPIGLFRCGNCCFVK